MSFESYHEKYKVDNLLLEDVVRHLTHIDDLPILYGLNGAQEVIRIFKDVYSDFKQHQITQAQLKVDGCIHGDTLLTTNEGIFPISEVFKMKDPKVLCYNFNEKKTVFSKIKKHPVVNNNKKWLEIIMENGESFKITSDHNVYTQRGWVEAGDLTENDDIMEEPNV